MKTATFENMKCMLKSLALAVVSIPLLVSCGGGARNTYNSMSELERFRSSEKELTFTVNGIPLTVVIVDGGTFTMGKTPEQGAGNDPVMHQVILDGFAIGKTEVTQALWEAVMGSNPSSVQDPNASVDRVTWRECQKFVTRLSKATGVNFRLPTEAEWEFAARGGMETRHYCCSGSQDGKARVNELGIYDMSGNVWEWVSDTWATFNNSLVINPTGPETAPAKVLRGGWSGSGLSELLVSSRKPMDETTRAVNVGLRVALTTGERYPAEIETVFTGHSIDREESDTRNETVVVKGVSFKMIACPGGTFYMGATDEQRNWAEQDEYPVHEVTLDNFKIGQYPVTVGLWKAVMDYLPVGNRTDNMPVVNVSWYDAQMFIFKLNNLTGRKFRLPSESEWEYAAREGQTDGDNVFAGSKYCQLVAVYYQKNEENSVQRVGTMRPNAFGIYDMSGNVWEWCYDRYGTYTEEPELNPIGPVEGDTRLIRGGSAQSRFDACRVSNRSEMYPVNVKSTFGFRIAL